MLDPYDSVRLNGAQLRTVVGLLNELEDPDGDGEYSDSVTLADRPLFEYQHDVLFVHIERMGVGGRSTSVQAYLAEDGTELVRKARGVND